MTCYDYGDGNLELSIILPTYNEAKNLAVLIPQIEKVIKANRWDAEIVVVDDSSPDKTANMAQELNKRFRNIRVLTRARKEGLGAALRDGYNFSRGEILLSMDADLSIDPKYIKGLVSKMNEGYDMVIGSRHSRGSGYENPNIRVTIKKSVSILGNTFTKSLLRIPVDDYSMNFRAIRRSMWKKIKTTEKRNPFLLEMVVETSRKGGRITNIPFSFKDRKYGESKMHIWNEAIPFLVRVLKYSLR